MDASQTERNLLLEYARHYGICRPLHRDNLDIVTYVSFLDEANISNSGQADNQTKLKNIIEDDVSEKLDLDAKSARFLASIIKLGDEHDDSPFQVDRVQSSKTLKLDLPVLRTDPDLDICLCLDRAKAAGTIKIEHFQPLTSFSEEDDAFSSPFRLSELWEHVSKRCSSEKLEIGRESVLWLKSILTDFRPEHNTNDLFFEEEQPAIRSIKGECLTPPLSPNHVFLKEASSPSSPSIHFRSLSEPASSSNNAAAELNERSTQWNDLAIIALPRCTTAEDQSLLDRQPLKQTHSNLGTSFDCEIKSSTTRIDKVGLKHEEPLMSPILPFESASRPSEDTTQLFRPQHDSALKSSTDSQDEFDAFFEHVVKEDVSKADAFQGNETLQRADANMRLPVPDLCFPAPPASWSKGQSKEAGRVDGNFSPSALEMLKLSHFSVSEIDKQLQWDPFPLHETKTVLEETIVEDGSLQAFTDPENWPGSKLDLDSFVYELPGRRLLAKTNDEDGLQPREFGEPSGLEQVVKKRRNELEASQYEADSGVRRESYDGELHATGERVRSSARKRLKRLKESYGFVSASFQPYFSASEELNQFIFTQTGTYSTSGKSNTGETAVASSEAHERDPKSESATNMLGQPDERIQPMSDKLPSSQTNGASEIQTPFCNLAMKQIRPRSIIVSSSTLSQYRILLKQLSTYIPCLELISRDFLPFDITKEHCTSSSQQSSPQALCGYLSDNTEADILVSPATGIILTTLQKIKQKPLPGRDELSAIRSRIWRICPRYEHLIILVHADALVDASRGRTQLLKSCWGDSETTRNSFMSDLSDIDKDALASLGKFAAELNNTSTISVMFVGHTNARLFHHVSSAMGIDAAEEEEETSTITGFLLPQEETSPELVLRRLGFNAFAAQAVLMELKTPQSPARGQRFQSSHGSGPLNGLYRADKPRLDRDKKSLQGALEAFLSMTLPERISRFAHIMGGTRVLSRTSKLIEERMAEDRKN